MQINRLGLWPRAGLLALSLTLGLGLTPAVAAVEEAGPQRLEGAWSLGRSIAQAKETGHTVHIIFVHGIRAGGRGTAERFVGSLCKELGSRLCLSVSSPDRTAEPERLEVGAYPATATLAGRRIWQTETEWKDSRPFVDRYVLTLSEGRQVVVDEVNWWPLLFPLKCRFLVFEDANLSGLNKDQNGLCRNSPPKHDGPVDPTKRDWSQDWAMNGDMTAARSHVWANTAVKQAILNWGLSDAVVALGPMRAYTREAMRQTFSAATKLEGRSLEQQDFTIVSESLGSFVVMDALQDSTKETALNQVMSQAVDLYFFANQFALLEIGRIPGLADTPDLRVSTDPQPASAVGAPTPPGRGPGPLRAWAQLPLATSPQKDTKGAPRMRQIIAFNDPNDALTFLVPPVTDVRVVNVYDHNGGLSIPGIATDPAAAHTGHSHNRSVIRTMLIGVD